MGLLENEWNVAVYLAIALTGKVPRKFAKITRALNYMFVSIRCSSGRKAAWLLGWVAR